jgi:hypothetical protein
LPEATPAISEPKSPDCHSVVRPSFLATALNRSTSKPMTVLPSVSRNSLGAYVESVPTTILPSALIAAGTIAASLSSTPVDELGAGPVGAWLFSEPQAARASARATEPSTVAVFMIFMLKGSVSIG